jgi:uncharacterized protein YjiS (DUF1127 family)
MNAVPLVRPADLSYRRLANLRCMIAAWRGRNRFRLELKRMARDNPHLIDDIGLTKRQVEE